MKRTKQTLIIAAICAVTLCGTLLLPPPPISSKSNR